jgi:hypothetical protein
LNIQLYTAMKTLLGLQPLQLVVEKETRQAAYQISLL